MTKKETQFNHADFAQSDGLHRFLDQLGVRTTKGAELMRLVRMAAHHYDAIMAVKMRRSRLSPPRLRLLLCLFAHEANGKVTMSPTELSRQLAVSKNTISAHLRALEEAGFVVRDVDPADLRQFQIRLAEAGRTFIVESAPGHMRYMDELAQELSWDEQEELQRLLGKLLTSLNIHGPEGEIDCCRINQE